VIFLVSSLICVIFRVERFKILTLENQPTNHANAGFLHGLIYDPEYGGDIFPKTSVDFHGVISRKIYLFSVLVLRYNRYCRNIGW
jgi:hypothetical protein